MTTTPKQPDLFEVPTIVLMHVADLKTDPIVFDEVWNDRKLFEIRFDDRKFQVGNLLNLKETKHSGEEMKTGAPLIYTGRRILARVHYVLRGPCYGLAEGWVIMSIVIESKIEGVIAEECPKS